MIVKNTLKNQLLQQINMLTHEQKQSVREMYDRGWNVEDIADHLDLDEVEVLDYVDNLDHAIEPNQEI